MCGRLNITDSPLVSIICEIAGVKLFPENSEQNFEQLPLRLNRFTRATDTISIIRETNHQRIIQDAIWWLLLDKSENRFKPSKYTSFNTRYDKLNKPGSAGYKAYRESRCIIPVRGFGETEGKGKDAIYTDFIAENGAIALGGLCRDWIHPGTGELATSCSVITLPPHSKMLSFHRKSSPLMLPLDDDTINLWLNSAITNLELFSDLLQPKLHQNLVATRIDKPSTYNPVAKPILLKSD